MNDGNWTHSRVTPRNRFARVGRRLFFDHVQIVRRMADACSLPQLCKNLKGVVEQHCYGDQKIDDCKSRLEKPSNYRPDCFHQNSILLLGRLYHITPDLDFCLRRLQVFDASDPDTWANHKAARPVGQQAVRR